MTVGNISPSGGRQCDKVMTEVDKCFQILPVIEVVVFYTTECSNDIFIIHFTDQRPPSNSRLVLFLAGHN